MEEKKSHFLTKPLRIYLPMVKKRASFQMVQLSECNGMAPFKSVSPFLENLNHLGLGIWLSGEEYLLCIHEDLSGKISPYKRHGSMFL